MSSLGGIRSAGRRSCASVFVASPCAGSIMGTEIVVDGGTVPTT